MTKKAIRKRFVRRKGRRKEAKVEEHCQENIPVEDEGTREGLPAVNNQSLSQNEMCVTSTADISERCTSAGSVISSSGFHDYTLQLTPTKSIASSSGTNRTVKESRCETSVCEPSSLCQPTEDLVINCPLSQSSEIPMKLQSFSPLSEPPVLPVSVLMEVKAKVEAFMHSDWEVILRQTNIHVVLLSKKSLCTQRNLIFSSTGVVKSEVHCKPIDVSPFLGNADVPFALHKDNVNEFVHRIVQVVEKVRRMEICGGIDEQKFKGGWALCQVGVIDPNPYQECRYVETLRSVYCHKLVPRNKWRCSECSKMYGPLKRKALSASKEEPSLNAANKYLTEEQKLWKLKEQQKALESKNKKIIRLQERMQQVLQREGVTVDKKLSDDLMDILDSESITPAHAIFLQQQVKASQVKNSKGMRWHPTMERLALSLHLQSPAAYEMLRQTGMIKLPSSRTLFDYSHVKPTKEGIDTEVLNHITAKLSKFKRRHQRYHVLMADEMHICQNLVFQKSTGALVGYTSLDEFEREVKRLDQFLAGEDEFEETLASKVLVYMVKGVSNGIKEVVATFAVANLSAHQLYLWTWDVIGALERSGIAVIAFISDGCSVNRAFIKKHKPVTKLPSGVIFDTINKAARRSGRVLYFMSDVPHLLKTIRNCLLNSRSDQKKGRRLMRRRGKKISWDFIIKLFKEKKGKNLRKSFKLNAMNVYPDSFSRMKVKFAAEILSRTVAQDLEDQGWLDASETIHFIRYVNDWFDCLNGAHTSVGKRKKNSNLNAYSSVEDPRFTYILSFLKYIQDWEEEARNANITSNCSTISNDSAPNASVGEDTIEEGNDPGEVDDTPGSKRILSRQTIEGIEMTTHAFIGAVKFLLKEGADFINARVFTQDPLEQHFSKVRAGQGGSNNPNLGQVLLRNRAIHTIGKMAMRKRKGNCGEGEFEIEVTNEPLNKRRCVRLPNST